MEKVIWDYHGIWILIGIVVGTIINIFVYKIVKWIEERSQKINLKTELRMNLKSIDEFLEEVVSYRNAIMSETLDKYYGMFRFGRILRPTGSDLFLKGYLYRWLKDEHIINLNEAYTFLSVDMENVIYKKMTELRQSQDYKPEGVIAVNLLEKLLKEHKKNLKAILDYL